MVGAGLITIAVLCSEFVIVLIMKLLGLTPEQQALAGAKREARDAERRRRANERAARWQQAEWLREVRQQNVPGNARFSSEDEAIRALNGRGGRPSNLDNRRFR
jgi:hypothetical protein